jgi:hypothetical protein
MVAHSKTGDDEMKGDSKKESAKSKKVILNFGKTTLGDVTDLAALKSKLEGNEKNSEK